MSSCNVDHTDFRNNGLITKIWGGATWISNHAITFGYPLEPTEEQKLKYKNYFKSLGDVLPCKYCRESYQKFITTGDTALTDEALTNRESLSRWFYRVHEAVNHKLEIDYGVTYEDMADRYESFRAKCGKPMMNSKGCVTPLDYKSFSFKKLYYVDAPIIPYDLMKPFIKLAKLRKLDEKYFVYLDTLHQYHGDYHQLKKLPTWQDRNKFCQNQIRVMRENGIPSVEEEGIWKGTPTMDELKLLMFMCSNLNRTEINEAIQKLLSNDLFIRDKVIW